MFGSSKQALDNEIAIYPLVLFRMVFGFLIFLESVGAIFTGWVKEVFIDTDFTFTFIGFEFLQAPDGYFMYAYYTLMGICGLMVMIGFWYKASITSFTILWTIVYLMQKSNYNNHYYLLIVICFLMLISPAHRAFSIDAKRKPWIRKSTFKQFYRCAIILQLFIIYSFASIAKMNPDWVAGKPINIWFRAKADYPIIGSLLQEELCQRIVALGGVMVDMLIIPFLVIKETRIPAFIMIIIFHLFNSAVFQIGIFPYLMIALCVFFFPPESIGRIFFRNRQIMDSSLKVELPKFLFPVMILFFIVQLYLPLRHHFYEGDVNCNEEGHRMAWRMMLRSKGGSIRYKVVKTNDEEIVINPLNHMTENQYRAMSTKPDMIWQFAQRIRKEYNKRGEMVEIYASSYITLNGSEPTRYIDPTVDLAKVRWYQFRHSEWILSCR